MPTSKTGPGSAPEPVLLFFNPPVKICQKKQFWGVPQNCFFPSTAKQETYSATERLAR
jgi:hypothetical protein